MSCRLMFLAWLLIVTCCACQRSESIPPNVEPVAPSSTADVPASAVTPPPASLPRSIPVISIGAGSSALAPEKSLPAADGRETSATADRHGVIVTELKPLQVMLGDWRGTTQKEFGSFKALDEPHWVWDFLTDKDQPALVLTSSASPYFRNARLTYLPESQAYRLSTSDAEGTARVFEGNYSQPVEEFQGDDRRIHRRYKLELIQTNAEAARDAWQVVFNQQDNNRYLLELARKRGTGYLRFDTVAHQRSGTSFAKSDEDYGDRECIISGGLGTMQVTYEGKSYWVCCSGCQAAFNAEPAKWLAEWKAKNSSP